MSCATLSAVRPSYGCEVWDRQYQDDATIDCPHAGQAAADGAGRLPGQRVERTSKWGATVIPASSAAAISAGHTASSGAPLSSPLPGGNQLATIVPWTTRRRSQVLCTPHDRVPVPRNESQQH